MNRVVIFLLALLVSSIASADIAPESEGLGSTGAIYTMCDSHTTTGDCTRESDEIVINAAGFATLTFYSEQSTSTNYACNIMSASQGHDAGSGNGFQVNSTSLSGSQEVLTLSGPFLYVWVTCPTNDDNQVTVKMLGQAK